MQDPRNFSYSTDYPQPIVAYRGETTITSGSGEQVKVVQIEHKMPFIPLVLGKWSESQDFTTAQDISSIEDVNGTSIELLVDATYVYIILMKHPSTTVTRYIRLVGFVPPDYDGDVQPLDNDSNFLFDSDYNYIGVSAQGILDRSTGGVVGHSLGYIPQCRCWWKSNFSMSEPVQIDITGYTQMEPSVNFYTSSNRLEYKSISTENQLIAYGYDMNTSDTSLSAFDKIYYHIYTSEA